ncbi:MAG TPA: type II toxin-antitoxin system RelE/ParE family toxin [Devosia sp.]|jgi:hypothetical protein|nr:type II toxin-antitoxin system RelE/ParE family toxin [Devosia sp.]
MPWIVLEHPDFAVERQAMPRAVVLRLAEAVLALQAVGPQLGRPLVDTLKGSRHANMKELRIGANGAWRVLFAFDPVRNAVLLVGGNKQGVAQARFYRDMIRVADARFIEWLEAED